MWWNKAQFDYCNHNLRLSAGSENFQDEVLAPGVFQLALFSIYLRKLRAKHVFTLYILPMQMGYIKYRFGGHFICHRPPQPAWFKLFLLCLTLTATRSNTAKFTILFLFWNLLPILLKSSNRVCHHRWKNRRKNKKTLYQSNRYIFSLQNIYCKFTNNIYLVFCLCWLEV